MNSVRKKRIRLVAFDMEGCLTADPTVWELMHRRLGTWQSHGLPYWRRYLAGELDYDTFARLDVAAWRGAPAAWLDEAASEVPLMPGCERLLQTLNQRGVHVAIISNGLECVARRFLPMGVRTIMANRAVRRDGRLTGELDLQIPYAAKGRMLAGLMEGLGLEPAEVAAVGDSAADAQMFRVAGLSVAFRPTSKEATRQADHVVEDADLEHLIPLLLDEG